MASGYFPIEQENPLFEKLEKINKELDTIYWEMWDIANKNEQCDNGVLDGKYLGYMEMAMILIDKIKGD